MTPFPSTFNSAHYARFTPTLFCCSLSLSNLFLLCPCVWPEIVVSYYSNMEQAKAGSLQNCKTEIHWQHSNLTIEVSRQNKSRSINPGAAAVTILLEGSRFSQLCSGDPSVLLGLASPAPFPRIQAAHSTFLTPSHQDRSGRSVCCCVSVPSWTSRPSHCCIPVPQWAV